MMILTVLAGLMLSLSVSAWGVVQVLNVMDTLDARRERKLHQAREALKYLKDPEGYAGDWSSYWPNIPNVSGGTGQPYTHTYTQGTGGNL